MEQLLTTLSSNVATLVESAAHSAVGIEARHRIGSSGFLWQDGVIVTTSHSLRRDEEIPVILPDGNRASAALAGRDPDTDIAVLRVNNASAPALTPAPAPRTGEIVVAVGRHAPGPLVSMGIVSTAGGPWKTWRGGQLDSLLRLDVGASPRSTGSIVVDTQGRFAGMLTTGLTRTAPVAIPSATIARVAAELLERGRIARGYLGVSMHPVPNREQRSAVMVLSVEPGGPAEKGGILAGDVILEIDSHKITDTDDVQSALRGAPGKELPIVVLRAGQRAQLRVKVGERP